MEGTNRGILKNMAELFINNIPIGVYFNVDTLDCMYQMRSTRRIYDLLNVLIGIGMITKHPRREVDLADEIKYQSAYWYFRVY